MGDEAVNAHAVLLTYYFAIERIARSVAGSGRVDPPDDAVTPHLERLRRSLDTASSLTEQVGAVRKAAGALQDLHSLSMRKRVEVAGRILCLEDHIVAQAADFTDFRHRRLSHASTLGTRRGRKSWSIVSG